MADNSLGAKTGVPVVVPVAGQLVRTYTPVAGTDLIGTTTSPTFGTVSLNTCNVIQTGRFGKFIWNFKQTGAGTAGSGAYRFKMPSGYTIDTAISGTETIGNMGAGYCGNITVNDGTTENQYACFVTDSTTISTRLAGQTGGGAWNSGSTAIFSDAALQFSITLDLPIVELALTANLAYGAGLATSVKSGLVSYEDSGSFTVYLKSGAAAGSTTSTGVSGTAYYSRVGKLVTVQLPGISVTITDAVFTISTSNTGSTNTWPAGLTPVSTGAQGVINTVKGGVGSASIIQLSTAGLMQIFSDCTGTSFGATNVEKGTLKSTFSYTVV